MSEGKRLVLFDVDGTLVKGEKSTGHAKQFNQAFEEVCGKIVNIRDFDHRGKTDKAIIAMILQHFGFSEEEMAKATPVIIRRETELFVKEAAKERIFALQGVKELLECLKKENCRVGVVTGNPREIAFAKLRRVGIADFFTMGGFGATVMTRPELIEMALAEAKKKFREEYSGKQIVVVGDTRRDVESAKPFGAKSIGVATGRETEEELRQQQPDFIFKDLSDTEKVTGAIFSD